MIRASDSDRARVSVSAVRDLITIRERAASAASHRGRRSAVLLGGGYVATALICLSRAPRLAGSTWAFAAALILVYALAYRTEFVAATGSAVPTEPILVAMVLLLPAAVVPFAALVGLQLGGLGAHEAGTRIRTFLVRSLNGLHCLGPVAVLWTAGQPRPSLGHGLLYALALTTQFSIDPTIAAVRAADHSWLVRHLLRPLSWTFAVDATLAPFGLCAALAAGTSTTTLTLLAAPIGLVRLLSKDRSEQLGTAVTLSAALTTVEEQARVDPLTGLGNRRAWDEAAAAATRHLRVDPPSHIVVIAADLDGLKAVNDTRGHEAGDALICAMADVLRATLPGAVMIARLGGDEYGAIIIGDRTDPCPAALLTQIRATMQAHPGVLGSPLSASLGAAQCPPAPSVKDAARLADEKASTDKRTRRAGRA